MNTLHVSCPAVLKRAPLAAALLFLLFAAHAPGAAAADDGAPVDPGSSEAASDESPQGEPDEALASLVSRALGLLLGAPVQIEELRRFPDENRLQLKGVTIGNPDDAYKSKNALAFERIQVKADPRQLLSRKSAIEVIDVGRVQVNAETTLRGKSNLQGLMENVKRFGDRRRLRDRRKWVIESLKLGGGEVKVESPLLGAEARQFDFKPVTMSLKGEDGRGMTLPEAAAHVLARIAEQSGMRSPVDGVSLPQLVDLFG